MKWIAESVVIFLTFAVFMLGAAWWQGRGELGRVRQLARQPEPFDLPEVLAAQYGPFPVDTGPLLLLSEQAAANVALEREIRQRCAEAEAKIPPRWR